jgi:hypothetical protein
MGKRTAHTHHRIFMPHAIRQSGGLSRRKRFTI